MKYLLMAKRPGDTGYDHLVEDYGDKRAEAWHDLNYVYRQNTRPGDEYAGWSFKLTAVK